MSTTVASKREELKSVQMGDVVQLTNGNQYEFIRLKQTKFLGKRDGLTYDVPVALFDKVISESKKEQFDPRSLDEGELFYVLNGQREAVVYRFKYMINVNKVMAENPVTGQGYRIGASMVEGSVRSL